MICFTDRLVFIEMKKFIIGLSAVLCLLITSCGRENHCSEDIVLKNGGEHAVVCTLVVADSIGVELGDSNYVFGAIREVDMGPGGDVYVLDWIKCVIFRYSHNGEYLQRIGGKGSGPGEMSQPGFFEVLDDGSICVADGNGWLRYDSTGESISTQPDEGRDIRYMNSAGSNLIAGAKVDVEWLDNQMQITKKICRFDPQKPDSVIVEYHQMQYLLETTDMNQFMSAAVRVDLFPMLFSAGDGFVCIAPDPVEEPLLLLFSEDGSLIDTLLLPYQRVPRTDDEIAEDKRFIEAFFHHSTGYTYQVEWIPSPNHPMIVNLGVDSLNLIWVQRGFEQYPTFDLYDISGEHLMTAVLPDRDDTAHWKFNISRNGILAVPEDPESYYSVYMIDFCR